MVTCFNAFLFYFLMDILKFWIILKWFRKEFCIILRVSRWMLLCKYECLDRFFICDRFLYFYIWYKVCWQHSTHAYHIYATLPTFNLICHLHFLLCLTYGVIFIDASQESCYGTVVTEHYFNLPKYYLSKYCLYCYPFVWERISRMCVLSISFLTYFNIKLVSYKQCMKVEQTTCKLFFEMTFLFLILKPNFKLLLQSPCVYFHPYSYIIIFLNICTCIIITLF